MHENIQRDLLNASFVVISVIEIYLKNNVYRHVSGETRRHTGIRVTSHERMTCEIIGNFTVCSTVCLGAFTSLFWGNPPVTGGFPSQKTSNVKNYFHVMSSSWCDQFLTYIEFTHLLIRHWLAAGIVLVPIVDPGAELKHCVWAALWHNPTNDTIGRVAGDFRHLNANVGYNHNRQQHSMRPVINTISANPCWHINWLYWRLLCC